MNSEEFEYWCRRQQLTAQTIDLIAKIRAAPPSRRVQASRRGLDIHFPRYLFQNEQDRQDFRTTQATAR